MRLYANRARCAVRAATWDIGDIPRIDDGGGMSRAGSPIPSGMKGNDNFIVASKISCADTSAKSVMNVAGRNPEEARREAHSDVLLAPSAGLPRNFRPPAPPVGDEGWESGDKSR
jgi:hypothetical protein